MATLVTEEELDMVGFRRYLMDRLRVRPAIVPAHTKECGADGNSEILRPSWFARVSIRLEALTLCISTTRNRAPSSPLTERCTSAFKPVIFAYNLPFAEGGIDGHQRNTV